MILYMHICRKYLLSSRHASSDRVIVGVLINRIHLNAEKVNEVSELKICFVYNVPHVSRSVDFYESYEPYDVVRTQIIEYIILSLKYVRPSL